MVALDASAGCIVWQKIVGQPTQNRFLAGATSVTTIPSRAYFSSQARHPVVYAGTHRDGLAAINLTTGAVL